MTVSDLIRELRAKILIHPEIAHAEIMQFACITQDGYLHTSRCPRCLSLFTQDSDSTPQVQCEACYMRGND